MRRGLPRWILAAPAQARQWRTATTSGTATAVQVRWPQMGSGCATLVAIVQAADLWDGDDVAGRGRLHGPRLGTILAEREMRPALAMIREVSRHVECPVRPYAHVLPVKM